MRLSRTFVAVGVLLAAMTAAHAGSVTLNGSASSTMDANVSEQATISVPATYAFAVTDITQNTPVTGSQQVTLSNIVLDDGNSLELWITAGAASFSPAAGGTVTYSASDVVWAAPTDSGVSGVTGALVNGTAEEVGESSSANPAGPLTFTVPFTLNAHSSNIDRAGTETLAVTWTVTSV